MKCFIKLNFLIFEGSKIIECQLQHSKEHCEIV